MSKTGGNKMKKFMKKVCLILMVTLLGVVSLMKADSVEGAAVTQIAINNMINIKIVDQNGNKIEDEYIYLYDANDKRYASINFEYGQLISNDENPVYKMGTTYTFTPETFQKFFTDGKVFGFEYPDSKRTYSIINVNNDPLTIKVVYIPNKTDYTLEANRVGLYIDPAWKNTPNCTIKIGSKTVALNSSTGLTYYNLSAGKYSGATATIGSNTNNYVEIESTANKREYIKTKMKLTDINSNFYSSDGYCLYDNTKIKIASGNLKACAMLIIVSGGMVSIPAADSQGNVEFYVDKTVGTATIYKFLAYNNGYVAGSGNVFDAYSKKEMTLQLKPAPSDGFGIMGVLAGKYTVDFRGSSSVYGELENNEIVVNNSNTIQEYTLVVHKHNFDGEWQQTSSNHWKECCGVKTNRGSHTYGSWVVDKEATEDAKGSKHRNCTVCNYMETGEIAKLPHTHNPSTTWSNDTIKHWRLCSCGSKFYNEYHNYGTWIVDKAATEDATGSKHRTCTECNYTKTATIDKLPHTHKHSTKWSSDTTNHWYECLCGDKTSLSAHTSKSEATETTAKVCDTCGYIMAPAIGHITHTEDTSTLYSDEASHWKKCVGCNLKMTEEEHNFEWIIDYEATEDMAGQKHEECIDCGYKKEAVEIPQIIIETEPDTEEPTEASTEAPTEELTEPDTTVAPTEEETNSNDNGFNWIWLVVGIVAVLGVIIVIIIILAKKKKEE